MSRWSGRLITKTPVTPGGSAPNASAPGVWTLPEMAYWKRQGLWPDASADAYWGYVSYLMATSSLSNANNNLFVDSSGAFNPVTRSGNTTQGAVTPYGTLWSNYLDGSSYLSAPASTAFAFGTGDFTVECWVNFMPGSAGGRITTRLPGGGAFGTWGFNISPTTFTFSEVIGGEPGVSASGLPNMTNAWVHLAACRSGSTLRLFANGVLVGSGSNTTNFNNSSYSLGIGAAYETAITGYLSNVRIVKGTALYTAAFTPPSAPLTAVSGTSILTCQSNRFRDNSSNDFAITLTGTPRVVPYTPFVLPAPGAVYNQNDISYWSGYFDGSGDYLNTAASSSLGLTGDWTVEGWIYQTSTAGTQIFLDTRGSGATGFGIYCSLTGFTGGPGAFGYATNSALVATSSTVIPLNAWTHLAVTRSGNTITGYINGVSAFTYTESRTLSSTMSYFIGADYTGAANAYGYMSNFRVVRGTAVYTGNFTPPAAPLTAISGTSLLTLQNAAFTDNSANNFAITANGNTTVTGNNPYQSGYYSNYFDGSGDYITAPANAAFALGSGDFTLECWVYNNEVTRNVGYAGVWSTSYILYREATVYRFYYFGPGGSPLTSSIAAVANAWTHLAVVRNGSTLTFYVNGAVGATTNVGTTAISNGSTQPFHIGTNQDNPSALGVNGYISNLRLVKGTAVYTSAFTPPTAPLTAISGTSLLTCQANRLIDSSSNAFTLTKFGDTAVVPFDPFYTATMASNGGSMYFDGDGDYLSLPVGVLPVNGSFTVETWFYRTSSANGILVYLRGGTGSYAGLRIGVSGGGVYLLMTTSDGTWVINSGVIGTAPVGTWNHIAVVRNSGTITMYLNGTSIYSTTAIGAGSSLMAGSVSEVGRMIYSGQPSDFFPGYMSDTRITTGAVLYTGNFTPPTAPLTPSANTTLLLNGMNAGTYDAAMQNNLETVGGAQVSSAQAKYGTTSVRFNGNPDYLIMPSGPQFVFGTGDFTVEGWVYIISQSTFIDLYDSRPTSTNGIYPTINISTSGYLSFFVNGADVITGTTSVTTGTWHHFALARSGTSTKLFLNGVQQGSTYTDTNNYLNGTSRPVIASNGYGLGNNGLNGYIDDLRVTKGYARYTANFTPPTAALPVY